MLTNLIISEQTLEEITDETNPINEPSIILLERQITYPNSKRYWHRFLDGKYRNPYCPNISFDLSMFESSLENGTAKIKSYTPNSKQTLLKMFPADERLRDYADIHDLYRD